MKRTCLFLCVGVTLAALSAAVAMTLVHSSAANATQDSSNPTTAYAQVSSVPELRMAVAQLPGSGGTICLLPGRYVLDEAIEIRSKNFVNIVGTGWDVQIVRRGEGDAIRLIDSGFCTIRNLLLQGDASARTGSGICFAGQCSSCRVDFCRIVNFARSGIRLEGDAQRPMSSNTIERCHFIGNLEDQLWSRHNNDFYIVGNQFGTHREHPRSGCVLDHSSAGTYSMNYHWGNQVALRLGPGANYNRLENNRLEESREAALIIGVPGGGDANVLNIISGNTIHTNSQSKSGEFPAVAAYQAHQITFCGNQVFSWNSHQYRHQHSLVIDGSCHEWIVKDNILRHSAGAGIVCDTSTAVIIKDNLTQ